MKKYYFYLSLVSVLLFLGMAVLGGYPGHNIRFFVSSIVYCIFSFVILSRISTRKEQIISLLIIILPPTLAYIPIHIIDFKETRISLPSTLADFLGFGFGIIIYASKLYFKIIFGTILLSITIWMSVAGYSLWIHKLNFGSYSGQVYYKMNTPIEGMDQFGKYITSQDLKDKTIVVDFWNTHCGVCFREFPEFQKLYENYKDDSSICFLAINKPLKQDTVGQAFAMINNRNYNFPTLFPTDETLPEKFGVESYPTIFVIDKEGNAIFRGSVEKVDEVLQGLKARYNR
jgi:thiol-disulfide isomerase/thioredoxin